MPDKKSPLKSKTIGAAAVIPLLTLIPGAKEVISSHPQESTLAVSLLFAGLRALTNGKIGF